VNVLSSESVSDVAEDGTVTLSVSETCR
jgi:hypothetical protein